MENEKLSIDKLSEEIEKTNKELQELQKWLDNLSVLEKYNKIRYYDNIISSYFEKLEELQTTVWINRTELEGLQLQTYILKNTYYKIQNKIKWETLSEINKLKKTVNKDNKFFKTLWWAWLIWWSAVQLDKIFSRSKYEESITWYKDMTRKQKRKARRKWRKENKLSFRERPFWRFLKRTWTGFWIISWVNALKDYNWNNNSWWNQETPWNKTDNSWNKPNNSWNKPDSSNPWSNWVNNNPNNWWNWNESNNSNESVFQRWRESKEKISKEKVIKTRNYIKNWWTFYSPSKWTVKRWEGNYKWLCSTWSYNVLWRLWLPKASDSLEVDLKWNILPKMWLNYVWTVDPNNPWKNGYKPQDGDTAVWPRFSNHWKMTQHQATYINWHRVSDTIQRQMSCYSSKNEPMCKIYRYHWENSETLSRNVVNYALKSAKTIANNNKYWYKLWWKGWDNWYDCCGLVCSVYRDAFKKAGLKEDKIPFTSCYHMKDTFKKAWFKWISPYSRSKLKPWDIMLDEDKHTEIYAWNWQTIWAHRDIDWKSWDSSWNEISLTDKNWMWKYFLDTYHKQYGRDWILRYEW